MWLRFLSGIHKPQLRSQSETCDITFVGDTRFHLKSAIRVSDCTGFGYQKR